MEREIAQVVNSSETPGLGRPATASKSHRGLRQGSARRLDRRWSGSRVQTLLFDVRQCPAPRAVAWARRHGLEASKVHRTERYLRIRQFSPTPGLLKRTIKFGRFPDEVGIRAVVEAR